MEPGASPYIERLKALHDLYIAGCKTWVSIEPYPTPNNIDQDITSILNAISFTNKILFGRTNYNKEIFAYKEGRAFYNAQAKKVIDFCIEHGIGYHIKTGTITEC